VPPSGKKEKEDSLGLANTLRDVAITDKFCGAFLSNKAATTPNKPLQNA